LLSQADTAGQAYRLWRLQRGIDADINAMAEARQQRLGAYLARTDSDGADAFDSLSPQSRRVMTDGGTDVDADFRQAVARASRSDVIDSYDQIDGTVRHIDSLPDAAQAPARRFVAASDSRGIEATLKFRRSSDADLATFVRKVDRLGPEDKRKIAQTVAEADDGAELGDQLGYYQLQRIADENIGRAAARIHDRDVDASSIGHLVDDGAHLAEVDQMFRKSYSGWSQRGTGLSGHYQKHVVQQNEWDGSITKSQYNQKAERLLSDSDGEVYYQTGRRNLAVYDPSENAYAVGNVNGDIQTLFQPSQGRQYVSNKLQNGDLIRLK
jgi:hypothetical protein